MIMQGSDTSMKQVTNTIQTLLKTLIMAMPLLMLSGCGGGDEIVFATGPAGPNTEQTLKPLPEGILPDRENARHTTPQD